MKFIAASHCWNFAGDRCCFAYFLSGSAPVAATAKTMPFEKFLTNGALHARIEKEMPKNADVPADESTYIAGARV